MIHINPFNKDDNKIFSPSKVGGKRRPTDKPRQPPFIDQLADKLEKIENQDLSKAVEQIDQTGQEFIGDPNLDTLNSYKRSVRQFLQMISRQTYRVKNIVGGRTNNYQIIETINNHLEELTQKIINNEKERLKLLSTLGEIKALIIDYLL